MKPERLLAAIGDISSEYLSDNAPAKRSGRPALFILAAALILLSVVGYAAARSGVIDRIFTLNPPGEDAGKLVSAVHQTAEGELFSFTVNEYVFDGENLYVDWTVQMKTDEPLILVAAQMETEFSSGFFSDSRPVGSLSEVQRETSFFEDGALSGLDRGHFNSGVPTEPFQITFHLALIRPAENVVRIRSGDPGTYENQPVWRDLGNGELYFSYGYSSAAAGSASVSYGGMYEWAGERFRETGSRASYVEMYEQFGFGTTADQLSLTFTVYPDGAHGTHLAAPVTFDQGDYSLRVLEAHFTGVNASVECEIPASDIPPSVLGLDFALYIGGERVDFAVQKDYYTDHRTNLWGIDIEFWSEGGFSETPEEITIVPGKYQRSEFIPFEGQEMTVRLE